MNNTSLLKNSKGLYIHSLHFPLALLKWWQDNPKTGLSTPLRMNQVLITKKNNNERNHCNEYTNSAYYYYMLHLQNRDSNITRNR